MGCHCFEILNKIMVYIKGISYYLPERVMTNEELVKEFPEWSVDKIARKVGVYSVTLPLKTKRQVTWPGKQPANCLRNIASGRRISTS